MIAQLKIAHISTFVKQYRGNCILLLYMAVLMQETGWRKLYLHQHSESFSVRLYYEVLKQISN